jgi:hypothetical protein
MLSPYADGIKALIEPNKNILCLLLSPFTLQLGFKTRKND